MRVGLCVRMRFHMRVRLSMRMRLFHWRVTARSSAATNNAAKHNWLQTGWTIVGAIVGHRRNAVWIVRAIAHIHIAPSSGLGCGGYSRLNGRLRRYEKPGTAS